MTLARSLRWVAAASLIGLSALRAQLAVADEGQARQQARALAEEGQKLLSAGDAKGALAKLEAADATFHAPTITVLIARALRALDRKEESYLAYTRAIDEALAPNARPEWIEAQGVAAKERSELAKSLGLIKLVVVDAPPTSLTLDGRVVPLPMPSRIPVKPGAHTIAWAAGEARGAKELTLAAGQELVLELALPDVSAKSVDAARPAKEPSDGLLVGSITSFAVGAAGVGAGIGLGVVALNKRSELEDQCVETGCLASAQPALDEANALAHGSTAGLVVGGVALALGGVLLGLRFMEASEPARVAVTLSPEGGFVGWEGAW